MTKPITIRKANRMIADGEAVAAWQVRWSDGSYSRIKTNRDAVDALALEDSGAVIECGVMQRYIGKAYSHTNAVGARIEQHKAFSRWIAIAQ